MTQIIFLALAAQWLQAPADNHTAFLVRAHTSTILLDSGPSIMRQLELAGVGVEELTPHLHLAPAWRSQPRVADGVAEPRVVLA